MFGIADKQDSARVIPVETRFMEVLDIGELPRRVFHLLILGEGTIVARIDGCDCHFHGKTVLCLDERKRFEHISGRSTDAIAISFLPTFLNINMTLNRIRTPDYTNLVEQHALFQLSPFFSTHPDKMSFSIDEDTHTCFRRSAAMMKQNLAQQPDWYWSCRTRSHFIDVINSIERMFHDYNLPGDIKEEPYSVKLQSEFRDILIYINNRLNEKITLAGLRERFFINKNKLEQLFQRYLNMSLLEYLRRRRFEEASYYLRFTELVGEEIAHRVGFSSAQTFCRFFTDICGQTPEKFRKEAVEKRRVDLNEICRIESNGKRVRRCALV